MPACEQAHVSGSQNPLQAQPQNSLDVLISRHSSFSNESIFLTPAARRSARLCRVGTG